MSKEKSVFMFFRSGIGRRMTILILGFSSIVTLVITGIQLRLDYERDLATIHTRMHEIEFVHLGSIINNLWLANHEAVKIHLEGLILLPDMQYITINLEDGNLLQVGQQAEQDIIRLDIPMHYTYRNERVFLGVLHVAATLSGIYHRLWDKVLVILVSQAIKTFLVSLFILVIFYRLVGRHLQDFAAHTRDLQLGWEGRPFCFDGKGKNPRQGDELDQLLLAFNELWRRQRADLQNLQKAEQELLHLRNLLANIIDSMPSVLIGVDLAGCVIQWNRKAVESTGCTIDHAIGRPLPEVYPLLTDYMDNIRQTIQQRKGHRESKIPWSQEGENHYADVTIYPLIANGVEGAVVRVDDITEQVHIEEVMIQAEKMLSVGGLAAGMAHEINNPLSGIMVNIQVIRQRLMGDLSKNRQVAAHCAISMEAITAYLEQRDIPALIDLVMASGSRAARIVENMLNFSRKCGPEHSSCDLAQLLDHTVELAAHDYDLKKHYDFRHIQIKREYHADVPPVLCVENNIQQVFLNILKNGAQAMAQVGTKGSPPCFLLRVQPDGHMVRVEITDNGPGMDEATRRRIFEPFFTTKAVGMGTGLGLSVSYFIITENHGGTLEVVSKPGHGSTFIICLPISGERG